MTTETGNWTSVDSRSWGPLHLRKVLRHRQHQPESEHHGQQTVLLVAGHLIRKRHKNNSNQNFVVCFPTLQPYDSLYKHHKCWPWSWSANHNGNKLSQQCSYSQSLVVNSLSLALTDLIKSAATIIGVKQISQLYFLTKVLNASLQGTILESTMCRVCF